MLASEEAFHESEAQEKSAESVTCGAWRVAADWKMATEIQARLHTRSLGDRGEVATPAVSQPLSRSQASTSTHAAEH